MNLTVTTKRFWEKESFFLLIIFLFLILIRVPILIKAYTPTIRWDEHLYMYNAGIFANFLKNLLGLGTAASGTLDRLYPPLTSLIQSLAFLTDASSFWIYRFILLLNAVIIATTVFPLYHLAKGLFPRQNPFPLIFLSTTSISLLGKSFWAMSEAVFIPLFIWMVYFAWRVYQRDKVADLFLYSLAVGFLVVTRDQALALIPIVLTHYLLVSFVRKKRLPLSRLLLLSGLTCVPTLLWQIASGETATRAESLLEGGGIAALTSLSNFVIYLQNWFRQLDYLYFGSFFLLLPLVIFVTDRIRSIKLIYRKPNFHLASLLILMTLGLILPSTLLMTSAQLHKVRSAKYLMYGRYIDMLIPLIIFFGVGVVKKGVNLVRKEIFFALSTLLIIGANLTFPWHAYYNFYWFANKSAVFWVPNVSNHRYHLFLFILFQMLLLAATFFVRKSLIRKAFVTSLCLFILIGNGINLWKITDIFLKRQDPSGRPLVALQSFIEESTDNIYIPKKDLIVSPQLEDHLYFLLHNFYREKMKFIKTRQEMADKQGYLLTNVPTGKEIIQQFQFGKEAHETYYLYYYK